MNLGTVTARHIGTPAYDLSLTGVTLPPWLQTAEPLSCKDKDPDTFFPADYGLRNRRQIDEARGLCSSCPVRDLCLEWAVPLTDLDGIWAATTPPERRRIRVARAKKAKGNQAAA